MDEDLIEKIARDLCDTYYLTVDPWRKMTDAWDKINAKTKVHWRAQAAMLIEMGYRREKF